MGTVSAEAPHNNGVGAGPGTSRSRGGGSTRCWGPQGTQGGKRGRGRGGGEGEGVFPQILIVQWVVVRYTNPGRTPALPGAPLAKRRFAGRIPAYFQKTFVVVVSFQDFGGNTPEQGY